MENQISKFNLGTITKEVLLLKKNVSQGLIQLGKRIIDVKSNLPANEYMEWLKREVKIPYVSAYRYIKIYQEINLETLEKVGASKVYEILELPPSNFRNELLQLAPNLKVGEVRKIVKDKKQEGQPEEAQDIIEQAIPAVSFADTALELNANLLDALEHITFSELPNHYLDIFESQLRKTFRASAHFLEEVKNVKNQK